MNEFNCLQTKQRAKREIVTLSKIGELDVPGFVDWIHRLEDALELKCLAEEDLQLRIDALEVALARTKYPTNPDTLRMDMEFNGHHITRMANIQEIESYDDVGRNSRDMWRALQESLSSAKDNV